MVLHALGLSWLLRHWSPSVCFGIAHVFNASVLLCVSGPEQREQTPTFPAAYLTQTPLSRLPRLIICCSPLPGKGSMASAPVPSQPCRAHCPAILHSVIWSTWRIREFSSNDVMLRLSQQNTLSCKTQLCGRHRWADGVWAAVTAKEGGKRCRKCSSAWPANTKAT